MSLSLIRFTVGRSVMLIGLRIIPPGKTRAELHQMLDIWSTKVRDVLAITK